MISVDVDGIDMFLLEEFGISHEEYLKEHVHQVTKHSFSFLVLCNVQILRNFPFVDKVNSNF